MADDNAIDQKPIEMDQPLGMFAADLFRRGQQFLKAFKILSTQGDDRLPHAQYFLLAHSLELILKAYLAAREIQKQDLHNIGHNIEELDRRARELGLPELQDLDRLVVAIAEMNSEHDFRYPTGYELAVPAPNLCLPIMDRLLSAVKPVVGNANLKAQIHMASDTRHLRGRKIVFTDPPKSGRRKKLRPNV